MDEKYSALFTPWKIGNVEIPNRIVQCSMGGTSLFGWLEPCHFDKEAAARPPPPPRTVGRRTCSRVR